MARRGVPVPKRTMPQTCTPQELLLIGGIMRGLPLTEALEAAGFGRTSYAVLDKPHIMAELRRQQNAQAKRFDITADSVLQEIASIAFANMTDFVKHHPATGDPFIDIEHVPPHLRKAIAEIEFTREGKKGDRSRQTEILKTKIKLHPKLPALEALAKHLGLFAAQEVNVNVQGSVRVEAESVLSNLSTGALAELEAALQKATKGDAEDAQVIEG